MMYVGEALTRNRLAPFRRLNRNFLHYKSQTGDDSGEDLFLSG